LDLIEEDNPPPWYKKFVIFGYPPGYLKEYTTEDTLLNIIDDVAIATPDLEEKKKEITKLTPMIEYPGIDNSVLIHLSYILHLKSFPPNGPTTTTTTTPTPIVISDSNDALADNSDFVFVANPTKNKKKTNLDKKGKKKEKRKKKKLKSFKMIDEDEDDTEDQPSTPTKVIERPQWSDASEGRYEPTESTGVWQSLTPIFKKRKQSLSLLNQSKEGNNNNNNNNNS